MAADNRLKVARARPESDDTNTLRLPRVDIVVDVPVLGIVPDLVVDVAYADGSKEQLVADDSGAVSVASSRGAFVDLDAETSVGAYQLRCFVHLALSTEADGAWQRLVNLGYVDDPAVAPTSPDALMLKALIEEFQVDNDLDPTGELDEATASALEHAEQSDVLWLDREFAEGDDLDDADYDDEEPKATRT